MKVDKTKWEKVAFDNAVELAHPNGAVQKKDYSTDGLYPIVSQEKDLISGFCDDCANLNLLSSPVIIFGDHTRIVKYVDFDFIVGADGVKVLIPMPAFNAKYLYYNLSWLKIPSNGYSRHFKFLRQQNVIKPSLPEQQAIAAELDAIQSVIDKLQEQLRDYDTLAQSIFNEMFGNVAYNDRKWDTDIFSSLFTLKSGKGLSAKQQIEGSYKVYGGNGVNGSHCEYNKEGSHIIIGRVGAYCGNVRVVNEKFWLTDNAFDLIQKNSMFDDTFLCFALSFLNLGQYANKAAQPVISNVVLKDVIVPLPPLTLQRQFAERIEAIEAQKSLLRQQIADARQLMDSRMQYYFE